MLVETVKLLDFLFSSFSVASRKRLGSILKQYPAEMIKEKGESMFSDVSPSFFVAPFELVASGSVYGSLAWYASGNETLHSIILKTPSSL